MPAPTAVHQLIDRVEGAMGGHDLSWEDRQALQDGVAQAGGLGVATWNDLAPEVQAKIEQIEKLPPTSWDDPSDAPDVDEED
jgi:hypothetical protein